MAQLTMTRYPHLRAERLPAANTFKALMQRLSAAGFKGPVARRAVLPDWWDATCEHDSALVPDVELRVARFLDVPLSVVRDGESAFARPHYPGAQLRQVKDIDRDRVGPAIHLAIRVAEAALRNWRGGLPALDLPPRDPLAWRSQLRGNRVIRLPDVLDDLWRRGIPVLHIEREALPEPRFQGMACIVRGRPVVVLGHDLDEPGHLAFIVSHEVGHVVYGDCSEGRPVVDEDDRNPDDADAEAKADTYAKRVLAGERIPPLTKGTPQDIATQAHQVEAEKGIDAALVVRRWGKDTGEHALATRAVQALGRDKRGKVLVRRALDEHLDIEDATDTDRPLLRCLHGDPGEDAASP